MNTASAQVSGDEMVLEFGASAGTAWGLVRAGSQKEQDTAANIRGKVLIDSGHYERGVAEWTQAADRGDSIAQNNLAWLYATAKRSELRDGKKAVTYAEKATVSMRNFSYLDTLAASLARDNQFERAVQVEEEALLLLGKDKSLPDHAAALTRFKNRLALYKAGQAYTEP